MDLRRKSSCSSLPFGFGNRKSGTHFLNTSSFTDQKTSWKDGGELMTLSSLACFFSAFYVYKLIESILTSPNPENMQQKLMDISNPSLVIFLSPLLLILILCIFTFLFPMFIHQSIVLIMRLLLRTYSKLGLGLDLLVNGSHIDSIVPDNLKFLKELGIGHLKCSQSDSKDKEDVECAVCLCKIEAGEELRELRCEHLFHRICLDRWVGFQRNTCPLCRDSLAPRRVVASIGEEQGFAEEVILKFTSFSAYYGRCRWWLR